MAAVTIREAELLEKIEGLRDALKASEFDNADLTGKLKEAEGRLGAANREIRDLNRTIGILQDRLRAAQSQGAV